MSVYSMTGYAHAQSAAPESAERAAVNIELRSVNGRFLDLAFRLPDELRSLEPALRDLLGAAFRRGKIELRLSTAREADAGWPLPTSEQLNRLSRLDGLVRGWLAEARPLSVNEALLWCRGAAPAERLDEAALLQGAGEVGTSIFHPVGTCRMGRDADAVVDPQLRVRGVAGLRVADASVMPNITSGNTNTPTAMIALQAAKLIAAARREGA